MVPSCGRGAAAAARSGTSCLKATASESGLRSLNPKPCEGLEALNLCAKRLRISALGFGLRA